MAASGRIADSARGGATLAGEAASLQGGQTATLLGRYNPSVITRGIREFVARDWAAARRAKDAYWAARIARLGPIEALRAAEELRQQARLLDPSWPDETSRREDLSAHSALAQRFRRVDSARRS